MSISPISLTYSAPQQATTSLRAQAFSDLANSLQSGNLQGAQQAYGILQQLQGNQASSSSGSMNMMRWSLSRKCRVALAMV